jgi:superfamily II DNA/RNA helicase
MRVSLNDLLKNQMMVDYGRLMQDVEGYDIQIINFNALIMTGTNDFVYILDEADAMLGGDIITFKRQENRMITMNSLETVFNSSKTSVMFSATYNLRP